MAEGDIVLAHSSLRGIGPVTGGGATLIQAMLEVLGPGGTLVVPTFTADNSDPSRWARTRNQQVPEADWPALREQVPAFDRQVTPTFGVGVLPELVRTWSGAVRSGHPQTSFAAIGARAAELMAVHDWNCHLGPASPLGALARTDAKVLLLAVPYSVCTAFHLAEYQIALTRLTEYECVVQRRGSREWYHYWDVVLDDSDFERLGWAFELACGNLIRQGPVGVSISRLFPLAAAVEFAGNWIAEHRGSAGPTQDGRPGAGRLIVSTD